MLDANFQSLCYCGWEMLKNQHVSDHFNLRHYFEWDQLPIYIGSKWIQVILCEEMNFVYSYAQDRYD